MKFVLTYESADDVRATVRRHYSAHRTRFEDFHARGLLLMIGHVAGSREEWLMAVFTTHEAADAFALGDPFVLNGNIRSWRIRQWDEMLSGQ